jgi:hypothetical protein
MGPYPRRTHGSLPTKFIAYPSGVILWLKRDVFVQSPRFETQRLDGSRSMLHSGFAIQVGTANAVGSIQQQCVSFQED